MSTLKVSEIRNASSATGGLSIAADGVVSGALPSPNRNLLYNGAMQVAQRGTSTTGITSTGYYTADRWNLANTTLGTWTQSIEADGPTGSGFTKSVKVLCTTADSSPAAGDFLWLRQILEGQDVQRIKKGTPSAEQLTLSFWVKSNTTGTYVCFLYDVDNNRQVSASYAVNQSGTWEKKVLVFPADTSGVLDNNNDASFQVSFGLAAGSNFTSGSLETLWASNVSANRLVGQTNLAAATNNYWQVTGVQLEVGDTATEFEFKSYGQELRECQRYYYRLEGNNKPISVGANYTATQLQTTVTFPVTMRGVPTLSAASGTDYYRFLRNGSSDYCNSFTLAVASEYAGEIENSTEISGTAGHGGVVRLANASAFVAFSAEL